MEDWAVQCSKALEQSFHAYTTSPLDNSAPHCAEPSS